MRNLVIAAFIAGGFGLLGGSGKRSKSPGVQAVSQSVFSDEPQSEFVVCHWTRSSSGHGCRQRVARKGNRDKAASGRIPWIGGGHRDLDRGGAHGDIDRHGIFPEINLVPSTVRAPQNGKHEMSPSV
jgi:hypothetical protein